MLVTYTRITLAPSPSASSSAAYIRDWKLWQLGSGQPIRKWAEATCVHVNDDAWLFVLLTHLLIQGLKVCTRHSTCAYVIGDINVILYHTKPRLAETTPTQWCLERTRASWSHKGQTCTAWPVVVSQPQSTTQGLALIYIY